MTAEELRRLSGGVVGQFTPKEITIDLAKDLTMGTTGDHGLGFYIPKGKFVYGAYIKNVGNVDLTSSGSATVALKAGSTTIYGSTPVAKGDLQVNEGKAELNAAPVYLAADSEVKLTVATAAITAGKLTIGVIYG